MVLINLKWRTRIIFPIWMVEMFFSPIQQAPDPNFRKVENPCPPCMYTVATYRNTHSGFKSSRSIDFVFRSPPCSYSKIMPEKKQMNMGESSKFHKSLTFKILSMSSLYKIQCFPRAPVASDFTCYFCAECCYFTYFHQ